MPEWHAWHWDLENADIARGDDMRKQQYDIGDPRTLLKQLSGGEAPQGGADPADGPGAGAGGNSVLDRWKVAAEKRKKEEEQRKAAERRKADKSMPAGWSKHWSSSKQRYYYHNGKTGENLWQAPPAR